MGNGLCGLVEMVRMFPLCHPSAQRVTTDLPWGRQGDVGGSACPGCSQVVSDFSEGGQDLCWDVALAAGPVFGVSLLGTPGYDTCSLSWHHI